jgi:hypothetical protein
LGISEIVLVLVVVLVLEVFGEFKQSTAMVLQFNAMPSSKRRGKSVLFEDDDEDD